jgi:hypothetical protein
MTGACIQPTIPRHRSAIFRKCQLRKRTPANAFRILYFVIDQYLQSIYSPSSALTKPAFILLYLVNDQWRPWCLAPPPIGAIDPIEEACWVGAEKKCLELSKLYESIAARLGCHFLNSQEFLTSDDLGQDGLHLAESGHAKLSKRLATKVQEILAERPVTAV